MVRSVSGVSLKGPCVWFGPQIGTPGKWKVFEPKQAFLFLHGGAGWLENLGSEWDLRWDLHAETLRSDGICAKEEKPDWIEGGVDLQWSLSGCLSTHTHTH